MRKFKCVSCGHEFTLPFGTGTRGSKTTCPHCGGQVHRINAGGPAGEKGVSVRFALPTDDRKTLAAHFGRAAEFAIFDADAGRATLVAYRPNNHRHIGPHGHGEGQGLGHSHDFDAPLGDVQAVVCHGLGMKAREALERIGARVVFTAEQDLERAAAAFAHGDLPEGPPSCECSHP